MSLERKNRSTSDRQGGSLPGGRACAASKREKLLRALAARLAVDELEEEALAALVDDLAGVTGLIRIGPDPSSSPTPRARGPRRWTSAGDSRRILACPIGGPREGLGFIGYVHDDALAAVLPQAEARLVDLGALLVVPARNAVRYAAALELAYKDPLTSLYNRRAFIDHLEREARRAGRSGRPLSVILLDLDRLKTLNDRWGHDAGDRALCTLAEVLTHAVRRADVVARIGGDEFAVLLPDTPSDAARRIATRIQTGLASRRIGRGRAADVVLAVSFGVAELGAGGDPAHMIEQADAELFALKRSRGALANSQRAPISRSGDRGAARKKAAS